ncbi:DNA phosphorothioation-associated putative methyltransferase [Halieaceae bacterium IMCC8485]|uniref:DNA phosphorothioation-associated putative methyltransferase n=1 Tax=Candidatus Seongchinamella marina TaxID=2518990 RepID=A0ABT3T0F8_9GAMM|nr:DNA phosphorothioation-associated putative methyltransferase [Candidatus Seongchinamella marina]MCX2975723.1 DNA phosphorothioation-associated putative methyltransferase [Candidatus Seongchinamella marina]
MDYPKFRNLVKQIDIGKELPDAIYVHESAISLVPESLTSVVLKVADALKINDDDWNIVKFYKGDFKVSFLLYPAFETDSYPKLKHSLTVDLSKLAIRKADYSNSENPPILHRKETFVDNSYPLRSLFEEVTAEGQALGLYENPRSIGFLRNWGRLISNKGYFLDKNGRLQPKENRVTTSLNEVIDVESNIQRHKTAIDRNQLSQPMRILARHNYLNGDYSILDYGCGKGDDLRELEAHGLDASGWDPIHYAEGVLVNSDIVNLGFVLNVIEDKDERTETLQRAWGYSDKLLVVSVMIAGDALINQFTPYKDGVITSRKTFQKYYAQSEFRSYVETVLSESAIAVGQGIFILFKDKVEEQNFLLERQHIKRNWRQKTQRNIKTKTTTVKKELVEKHLELFTDFWEASLEMGRIPANSEFEFSEQIRRVAGSHAKAHSALLEYFGQAVFDEARIKRKEDLLVYFALGLFEKRKPQTQMPGGLRRDIKAFYGSYNQAIEQATDALFSVGNPKLIENACETAYSSLESGEMTKGHSYTFHKDLLGHLPTELRIYIGCAIQLYGDLEGIQLVKAHITSGKVSLMGYKDWESETPLLIERIKIKMREQDVEFFDYVGRFNPTPLVNKLDFVDV